MIIVAVLLLPVLGLLLYGMDRMEDGLYVRRRGGRHARARHLRLVRGEGRPTFGRRPAGRHADAA
ncbi:hypothetical protein [Streptomyces sp. NPDC093094]|uniref:hypothetical protein n=1 Tax=Streptomyces sp. NPDC093094 TaxID=3366026 RepID=UPI0038054D31